jgi:hypothetical protein
LAAIAKDEAVVIVFPTTYMNQKIKSLPMIAISAYEINLGSDLGKPIPP